MVLFSIHNQYFIIVKHGTSVATLTNGNNSLTNQNLSKKTYKGCSYFFFTGINLLGTSGGVMVNKLDLQNFTS